MERVQLSQARHRRHWSLEAAAEQLGVDPNTLNKWELGKATPRGYNIARLCEVYAATSEQLGLNEAATLVATPIYQQSSEIQSLLCTDLTMQLIALAFAGYRDSQQIGAAMTRILEGHLMETAISRREALRRLATLPFLALPLGIGGILAAPLDGALSQYAASIAACRELTRGQDYEDLALAFKTVSAYLPILKAIVKDSSQHRKAAANLAAQCAHLMTTLGWHLESLQQASMYAREAIFYAKESGDHALLISALVYQAWVHCYDHQPRTAVAAVDQAVALLQLPGVPTWLIPRVYSTHAIMEASAGQDITATLRSVHTTLSASLTSTDYYTFADQTIPEIIANEATALHRAGNHDQALDIFDQLMDRDTLTLKYPLAYRTRVEIINAMTMASLKSPQKDMERTVFYWQAGMSEAKTLQSRQRFTEVVAAYDVMEALWPKERKIKELRTYLH